MPDQARSAGRGARDDASKQQNNFEGTHKCGRASHRGTLSDAAGRGPAIHIGTDSGQPPYFGHNLTLAVKFVPRRLFFLLDRARPVFFFLHKRRKKKMGGASAQPSSWLKSSPPARAGKNSSARRAVISIPLREPDHTPPCERGCTSESA